MLWVNRQLFLSWVVTRESDKITWQTKGVNTQAPSLSISKMNKHLDVLQFQCYSQSRHGFDHKSKSWGQKVNMKMVNYLLKWGTDGKYTVWICDLCLNQTTLTSIYNSMYNDC